MPEIRVQLLGSAAVVTVGETPTVFANDKRYRLLAYLAYQADWVSRESLAHLFWADSDTTAARKNLRHLIGRTRALEWLTGFDANLEYLRWRVPCDVHEFRAALERAAWDEALKLYDGPVLAGNSDGDSPEYSDWLEAERESLGILLEPFGDPQVRGFEQRVPDVFGVAKDSQGFVALLSGPPDVPAVFSAPEFAGRVAHALSIWRDLESVMAYSYGGLHAEALAKRKDWFTHGPCPGYVAL